MDPEAVTPSTMPRPPPLKLRVTASIRKLHHNLVGAGSHRAADSDLVRAFRDGEQHDVHDADTSDDQRYGGNAGKQCSHRAAGSIERLAKLIERYLVEVGDISSNGTRDVGTPPALGQRLVGLPRNDEVLGLLRIDAMAIAQQCGDGLAHTCDIASRRS